MTDIDLKIQQIETSDCSMKPNGMCDVCKSKIKLLKSLCIRLRKQFLLIFRTHFTLIIT